MYRIRLSRGLLAALAVATLASGGTLVTSSVADAAKIDPGFSRGPPRIDPGFGNGPTKIDPGFGNGPTKAGPGFTTDSGPKYTGYYGKRPGGCHWIDRPGMPQPKHPGPGPGQNTSKIQVCY